MYESNPMKMNRGTHVLPNDKTILTLLLIILSKYMKVYIAQTKYFSDIF